MKNHVIIVLFLFVGTTCFAAQALLKGGGLVDVPQAGVSNPLSFVPQKTAPLPKVNNYHAQWMQRSDCIGGQSCVSGSACNGNSGPGECCCVTNNQ